MTQSTIVNTKTAPRRELSFHCTGCLKEELARVEAAHAAGTLTHTGNWTAGENLDHIALVWEFAFDGPPAGARVPFLIRLAGPLMKRWFTTGKTLPAGFKIPQSAAYMEPRQGVAFDVALARLRRVLDRLDRGERMEQRSPAFGAMSHDEWLRLHLGHAQLHLGFLRY